MSNYILDYGPVISGTPFFSVFRDISTDIDYIDSAPTLDALVSGWTQFEWTSGVNIHFRAEINNNAWITGIIAVADTLPIGDGSVRVDHDYGGTDSLRIMDTNDVTPIDGATLTFYFSEDYNAGNLDTAFFARAWATTNSAGRFVTPVYLDPGVYTILVTAAGKQHSVKVITVS